jgi:hypothetical protein
VTDRDRRIRAAVLRGLALVGAEPTMANLIRAYLVIDDMDPELNEEFLAALPEDALPPPLPPPEPMDPDFTARRDDYLNRAIIDEGGVPDEESRAKILAGVPAQIPEAEVFWHLAVDGEGLSGPWRELLLDFAGAPIELPDEDPG